MNSDVSKTLELNKILAILERFTSTPAGAEAARRLAPSSDVSEVKDSLSDTTEGRRLLEQGKRLPLAGTPDVRPHLDVLRIEQQSLAASALLELTRLAQTAEQVGQELKECQPTLPRLLALAGQLPNLRDLRIPIEKAIDLESGEIKDDASPELRRLRARLFKLRRRLESVLESYFKQKDSQKMLQDQIVTVRNGRSVLPVKAECRGQLVGIVHGSSASGATVFIEPLSTVELNNDIVSVQEQEQQEIERILASLTELARSKKSELARTIEVLSRLDLIQAKAFLSEACAGAEPRVGEGKTLHLVSARHPLLLRKIVERLDLSPPAPPAKEAVPLSFRVDADRSVLVFTGPNTGGKTVALKTAGLLSLMAQTGLHVPADPESSFPVFRKIFADIGDEQSIGSSLSTFSAHLRNIVEMERDIEEPSLVLLDEVGAGTDPAEGGALGTALVEHFRRRGALVLASTHHGMLKAYATNTPGVRSASFEFNPETYEPTYRLVENSTGRSLAFEIARRFGLPEVVVRHARELQNQKERQVEGMLERLEEEGQKLARDREKMTRDRRALEASVRRHKAIEEELVSTRDEQSKNMREKISAEIAHARREIREILEEARERSVPHPAQAISETREQLEVVAARFQSPPSATAPLELSVGEAVHIASLQLTGQVVEILGDNEVEVVVRDKRLRIPVTELEVAIGIQKETPGGYSGRTQVPETKHVPQELNVIGCTVDEAISQADKFLDDAFLSEHRTVRLIHGLGRGRLKKAIGKWLETHTHVASHQPEGSGAVTVVELKS
jgi:DNA mismatch repair protein MutS2